MVRSKTSTGMWRGMGPIVTSALKVQYFAPAAIIGVPDGGVRPIWISWDLLIETPSAPVSKTTSIGFPLMAALTIMSPCLDRTNGTLSSSGMMSDDLPVAAEAGEVEAVAAFVVVRELPADRGDSSFRPSAACLAAGDAGNCVSTI